MSVRDWRDFEMSDIERLEKENAKLKDEIEARKKSAEVTMLTWDESDKTRDEELSKLRAHAEAMECVIQHALALGHLGDGSTRGWALDVRREYLKDFPREK